MSENLLPLLERIAVAWERQAVAAEAVAAAWAVEIARATERLALDWKVFDRDAAWQIESKTMREEDIARRAAEREEDRRFVLDKEERDRAGWLSQLTRDRP